MNPVQFRTRQARLLPQPTGVYALCDLNEVPIYVGLSVDGIRARVRRHLTSARSDVVANRQLDVWEIAYVWAWPVAEKRILDRSRKKKITDGEKALIELIERHLYHEFNEKSALINGTVVAELTQAERVGLVIPEKVRIQVMPNEEIASRLDPARRLPRQADHFRNLLDHMLNVKNEEELRRALRAHFTRLEKYCREFLAASAGVSTAGGDSSEED